MTAFRRIAAAIFTAAVAVVASAADPKGYGKYPCDPHPLPKFPPIILPPIPKLPQPVPTVPATKPNPTALAKVAKGK